MNLGSNWNIFFMYSASPNFNSLFAAKPLGLLKSKVQDENCFSILFIHPFHSHQSCGTCWHHLLILSFRAALGAVAAPTLVSASCSTSEAAVGALLCSALLSAFLPKEEELEEQPVQYPEQDQSSQDVFPEPGVPSPAWSICSWQYLCVPRAQPHSAGTAARLAVLQRETLSITEIKAKPGISSSLRISDNIFNAFWCDHISWLICVISLSFSSQSKLKFLLHLCPAPQFCCILTILLSNSSASATAILSFLLLSNFMNEIPLTCFFLTKETLCRIHFLCSFTIN